MRENITRLNKKLLPGNLFFARGYAAIDAIRTCPKVPKKLTNMLLKIYLEKGTKEVPIK
jgi:hypothetical protein